MVRNSFKLNSSLSTAGLDNPVFPLDDSIKVVSSTSNSSKSDLSVIECAHCQRCLTPFELTPSVCHTTQTAIYLGVPHLSTFGLLSPRRTCCDGGSGPSLPVQPRRDRSLFAVKCAGELWLLITAALQASRSWGKSTQHLLGTAR